MKNNIDIACTVDDGYVQHLAVMLESLFSTNKKKDFNIHVITEGFSEEKRNKLLEVVERNKQKVNIYNIDTKILKNAPLSHHLTLATYFRLFLPVIIPNDIDKILFIDADVIVNGNIDKLWNEDIQNFPLAAVENPFKSSEKKLSLGMSEKDGYFNAGILLINLKWWRKNNLKDKFLAYIERNHDILEFHDQDVLNGVIRGNWKKLHPRWNAQGVYFVGYSAEKIGITQKDYDEVLKSPIIIHYTGSKKPWYYKYKHPFKKKYYKYLKRTPYRNFKPIGKPKPVYLRIFNKLKQKI